MEIGEFVGTGSVIAILLAIFGMGLVLIQRIDSRYDRLDTRIEAQGDKIDARIEAASSRISDAEREQARLEGVNSVLERLAHSLEPRDHMAD